MRKQKALIWITLAIALCLVFCVSFSGALAEQDDSPFADLTGKRIGIQLGTPFDTYVKEQIPDADLKYFNTYPDMISALLANKIDAFPVAEMVLKLMAIEEPRLAQLDGYLTYTPVGIVFPKTTEGQKLCSEMNEFIASLRESGELDRIFTKWVEGPEEEKTVPDYTALPATNGKLTMATGGTFLPFEYYAGDQLVGIDIELVARFCEAKGYALDIMVMNFDGILMAVQNGVVDFSASGFAITEERKESVLFSDPYGETGTVMAVLKSKNAAAGTSKQAEFTQFSDLSGKTVSMIIGAPFENLIKSKVPDVKEFSYYNNMADMLLALKSRKTDAILLNNAVSQLAINRNQDLILFPQSLQDSAFGIAFAKGDSRRDDWQAAFESIPEETIQAAWEKWTGVDEEAKVLPPQDWPGTNGTVKASVCDTLEPMSYAGPNGELMGFDIEIILLMAKELDVHVEFTGKEFAAILSDVQAGKALLGAGSIIVTDERKESMDFVEYFPASFVLVVRCAEGSDDSDLSFWDSVVSSFNKTFIRENRWQLFVYGVLNTLLITVLAVLFGTALGFLTYMRCRKGGRITNAVTRSVMALVHGMPMVVLLMVLYYIIFGSISIGGLPVAVFGFTLTFGSSVFSLLKIGVGAVDHGQYEAAYALGYSERRAFFRIILPQALPHVMSAYRGEIVGLIKATAIVGYIAVQDLTKMGDIVRSRTYEAFFPLIAITIIYFGLEALFISLVKRIEIHMDPKHRQSKDILKGIRTETD